MSTRTTILTSVLVLTCALGCKKQEAGAIAGPKGKGSKPAKPPPAEVLRRLDALRAAGEPTTLEELSSWYASSPERSNTAALYETAFALLPASGSEGEAFFKNEMPKLPPRGAAAPKTMLDALARFCANNKVLLNALHAATQNKECRYPLDMHAGIRLTLPHLARLKQCSLALKADAYLAVEQPGQAARAVERVQDQIILAESLAAEPIAISQLTRFGCLAHAEDTLERMLNRTRLTEPQLAGLEQSFRGINNNEAIKRMVMGQRCLTIASFMAPDLLADLSGESATNNPGARRFDFEGYRDSALFRDDFLFSLDNTEGLLKALETPFPEAMSVARTFGANIAVATTNGYFLSAMALPSLGGVVWSRYPEAEARQRVLLAVLAVERARLQSPGHIPENRDDPVIQPGLAALLDPFDGKPLRYHKRTADSYVVYSVGPDAKDDGGVTKEARPKGQTTFDLAFSVGPPQAAIAPVKAAPAQPGTPQTRPPSPRPKPN